MRLALCTALALSAAPFAAAFPVKRSNVTGSFSQIVVLGDSYSDDGAPYGCISVTNGTWPKPDSYFQGHFSNSLVWPQLLAPELNISAANLLDLAVGGATVDNNLVQGFTGYNGTIPVPGVAQQAQSYLSNKTATATIGKTLFILMAGLNDILFNYTLVYDAKTVVGVLEQVIHNLTAAGATQFVLGLEPSLNDLPYLYTPAVGAPVMPSNFSDFANYAVDFRSNASAFVARSNGTVALVDLGPLFTSIEANGTVYGVNNSYLQPEPQACIRGSYPDDGQLRTCNDPDSHLFWDIYHPSFTGHTLIAQSFLGGIWNTFPSSTRK